MDARILVSDRIAEDGNAILRSSGAEVDVRLDLSAKELVEVISRYDGLIVRSQTKVTSEVIEAGTKLQVVGRAGVGVDNIDLQSATEKGVVVVNAPTGNVVSAAEHALGLMLCLSRNIPQANAALKAGRWERSRFVGVELRAKTLGIVGLGQVGSELARRAHGLEMDVLAFDPFVPEERARVLGLDLVSLEELLERSDFVSLHTTLTDKTADLIGEAELRRMKPTARIINAARGGLIDEEALARALEEGRLGGAALDVFAEEPFKEHPLLKSERVVMTPHLGASTEEAQERVAVNVAEQVVAVLRGEPARYAVNAPMIAEETYSTLAPYLSVAEKAGAVAVQLCEGQLEELEIDCSGEISTHDFTPLRAAVVRGLLAPISEEQVSVVNADIIAQRRGLRITEKRGSTHEIYANLVSVRVTGSRGETTVSATLAHDGPHIVLINDFWVDIPPGEGYLLLCENEDRPGIIGALGSALGSFDVNISFMRVGRHARSGRALMAVTLDDSPTSGQLEEVRKIPNIYSAELLRL